MNRAAWLLLVPCCIGTGLVLQQVFSASDEEPSIVPRDGGLEAPAEPDTPAAPPSPAADELEAPDLGRTETPAAELPPELSDRLAGVVSMTDGTRVGKAKVRLEIVDLDALLKGPRGTARFDLAVADPDAPIDETAPIPGPILKTLETTTNDVGEFEFSALPCPAPHVFVERRERLIVEKEGFAPGVAWPFRRETTNFVMIRRDILRGICRDDATDAPIPNAELIVTRPHEIPSEWHVLTTHTDADGRFVTEKPLEEGSYSFTIIRDGHAPRGVTTAIRFDFFDLEFENHPTYVVRVKDATTGNPLSGVRVFVDNDATVGRFASRLAARNPKGKRVGKGFDDLPGLADMDKVGATDSGGELRIRDLAPLSSLLLDREGFVGRVVNVPTPLDHGADRFVVDVELTGCAFLRGQVTEWSGAPLAGALVSAGNAFGTAIETDAEGRFTFPIAPHLGARGLTLHAFDRDNAYRASSFPFARVGNPGDAVDLGTVALIRRQPGEIEEPRKPKPPRNDSTLEARTSARAPIVELWRQRRWPGYETIWLGEWHLRPREFVGYAVVDDRHRVTIEISNHAGQAVSGTCHDGYWSYPVCGISADSGWPYTGYRPLPQEMPARDAEQR